jgi:hypothetical protein
MFDVVIGAAEVSATGGHQALQDGEALTVARVSECGAYFPTANSLPIRPTHWREYNPEDAVRFYALRLREAGMIKSSPNKILADGTDWRHWNELKRELKG